MKRHQVIAIAVCLSVLAGCATTDSARNGYAADTSGDGYYVDGYYSPAHDGFGDYYYDRTRIAVSGDPWALGSGYGWYGIGFSPWGPGFAPWYYGGPWYWHHHRYHWQAAQVAAVPQRRATDAIPPKHASRHDGPLFPSQREPEIRASRHGFRHP